MSKYKYYFRKPRSEIAKDILLWSAAGVSLALSGGAPVPTLLWKSKRKHPRKKFLDTFTRLQRAGLIETHIQNNHVYIALSPEGKKRAGRLQIDALEITRPLKWDGKWRVLIFDIGELRKVHREAFRGKLRHIGFQMLQKSVWIFPFPCQDEVEVLRDFFQLSRKEARLITAENIGDDAEMRRIFSLT